MLSPRPNDRRSQGQIKFRSRSAQGKRLVAGSAFLLRRYYRSTRRAGRQQTNKLGSVSAASSGSQSQQNHDRGLAQFSHRTEGIAGNAAQAPMKVAFARRREDCDPRHHDNAVPTKDEGYQKQS